MPGPPPTPPHLKLLRGNPGHQKLRAEPQPLIPKTCPEPPAFISDYAADEWLRIAPELHGLGLFTRVDVPALAICCHAYGQWRLAAETLAKMAANDPVTGGQIIKTKYGDAVQNPLVSIARKHAADMVRYAGGSRLAAGTNAPPPGGGKFAGLLG
jgi:P27 family predicted phage terminase small subunit